jgi:hypothetical protein
MSIFASSILDPAAALLLTDNGSWGEGGLKEEDISRKFCRILFPFPVRMDSGWN